MYDYLIVGSGLFGCVCARELTDAGYKCMVLERRNEIGGNCVTHNINGIVEHVHGPHIFHTNDINIWNYVSRYLNLNNTNFSVIANYKGKVYNLPFNMNTFSQILGTITPNEAKRKIEQERGKITWKPSNLEEQAISLVGETIYETLIKGYVRKQWGRECDKLPADIINRLPVRYSYDNSYYNDKYVGIPSVGYSELFNKLLDGIDVRTGVDFLEAREAFDGLANKVIFTGEIDRFFNYKLGYLEYRSLRFERRFFDYNVQGCAIVSYTDYDIPYTRTVEHKYFDTENFDTIKNFSLVTYEYPQEFKQGMEAYYPINDNKNQKLYNEYADLAKQYPNIIFGGRLGSYKYNDMDDTIISAKKLCETEITTRKNA